MTQPAPAVPTATAPATPVVEVVDADVALGGIPVLRGVSLTVGPGEVVAVGGGNGSGKSTLVRTLLGLVAHRRGSVRLFGDPLARFRAWHRVGYVPQRAAVALHATAVGELVASGRLARRRPFVPASRADKAAVATALDLVGMTAKRAVEYVHLSGGQQQRVLIARALAGEPDLLVLDEPFVGVDLATQRRLADLFGDLRDQGTAVLVVLHETGPLGRLVDRTVTLRDGRVVAGADAVGDHHRERTPRVSIVEGMGAPWSS